MHEETNILPKEAYANLFSDSKQWVNSCFYLVYSDIHCWIEKTPLERQLPNFLTEVTLQAQCVPICCFHIYKIIALFKKEKLLSLWATQPNPLPPTQTRYKMIKYSNSQITTVAINYQQFSQEKKKNSAVKFLLKITLFQQKSSFISRCSNSYYTFAIELFYFNIEITIGGLIFPAVSLQ